MKHAEEVTSREVLMQKRSQCSNELYLALFKPTPEKGLEYKSPQACALSGMHSLSSLKKIPGEAQLLGCLALWINDLQSFLNISAKMNLAQVAETCRMILDDFWAINLADVQLVMARAKRGTYGTLYGRIDGQIIYQWFAQYFEERCESCGSLSKAQADVMGANNPVTDEKVARYMKQLMMNNK